MEKSYAQAIILHHQRVPRFYRTTLFCQEQGLQKVQAFASRGLQLHTGDIIRYEIQPQAAYPNTKDWDVVISPFPYIHHDPLSVHLLQSCCDILRMTLAESHPYRTLYESAFELIHQLRYNPIDEMTYLAFELCLLQELGFGLDLQSCAVTGTQDRLSYISPKSGRAVCEDAAAPYQHQLLPYPAALKAVYQRTPQSTHPRVAEALAVTGYFLQKHLLEGRSLPPARALLIHRLK